jgi:hypothetical protein
MANYKHKDTGTVISSSKYYSLPYCERVDYGKLDDSGDFLTTSIIGVSCDSTIVGALIGGPIIGGVLGEPLERDLFD